MSRERKDQENEGDIETKLIRWVYLCREVGFKLLSEKGNRGRDSDLIRKSISHGGSIKSRTITKLLIDV